MTTRNALESKIHKYQSELADLQAREDLTYDEKRNRERHLRRAIRRFRKKLDAVINDTPQAREVQEEVEKVQELGRKNRRAVGGGRAKTTIVNREGFIDELIQSMGPPVVETAKLQVNASMAFSGALVIDSAESSGNTPEQMGAILMEKFQKRWNRKPDWVTFFKQGEVAVICLGPVTTEEMRSFKS